jgi:hypothetical protein
MFKMPYLAFRFYNREVEVPRTAAASESALKRACNE